MNPKWLRLAADLLELASDQFSNNSCNDYEWPKDWSDKDKIEFQQAIHINDPPDYSDKPRPCLVDWLAMDCLAVQLRAKAERAEDENG